MKSETPKISVVVPTYGREEVLVDTLHFLLNLSYPPAEILLVDQTPVHLENTQKELEKLHQEKKINWIRLTKPSITHAMNVGLLKAKSEIVLFLDDDIVPDVNLIKAHQEAHRVNDCPVIAGQVLQPGEKPDIQDDTVFSFRSTRSQYINEFMGGNFSVKHDDAIALGGFDECFVKVAYRFEAEFAQRVLSSEGIIYYEPKASIHHLRSERGGTRSYGSHLKTLLPNHAVGAYYFFLRGRLVKHRWSGILHRPLRAIRTRHHLMKPWWIPVTLVAEFLGFLWAVSLYLRGPKLIDPSSIRNVCD